MHKNIFLNDTFFNVKYEFNIQLVTFIKKLNGYNIPPMLNLYSSLKFIHLFSNFSQRLNTINSDIYFVKKKVTNLVIYNIIYNSICI